MSSHVASADGEEESVLTPKQLSAVLMQVRGWRVKTIAQTLGVHRNTVRNWRRSPAYQRELRQWREEFRAYMIRKAVSQWLAHPPGRRSRSRSMDLGKVTGAEDF